MPMGVTVTGGEGGGSTGPRGYSAYEIAVQQGFVGTQADWLNSLIGADGADGTNGTDGADGAQGPQGIQGIQGIQGETGPVGPQGPAGADGADGTGGGSSLPITGPVDTGAPVVENYTTTTWVEGNWYTINYNNSVINTYKCVSGLASTKFTQMYELEGGYGTADGTLVLSVPRV